MLLEGMALRTVPGGCLGDRVPQNKPYPRQGSPEPCPAPSPTTLAARPQRMGCHGWLPPRLRRAVTRVTPLATPPSAVSPPGLSTGRERDQERPGETGPAPSPLPPNLSPG